jgi:hypothetical protein
MLQPCRIGRSTLSSQSSLNSSLRKYLRAKGLAETSAGVPSASTSTGGSTETWYHYQPAGAGLPGG